jgi:hypothetical protein
LLNLELALGVSNKNLLAALHLYIDGILDLVSLFDDDGFSVHWRPHPDALDHRNKRNSCSERALRAYSGREPSRGFHGVLLSQVMKKMTI